MYTLVSVDISKKAVYKSMTAEVVERALSLPFSNILINYDFVSLDNVDGKED